MRNGNKQREAKRDYARKLDIDSAHLVLDREDVDPKPFIGPRVKAFVNDCMDTITRVTYATQVEYDRAEAERARRLLVLRDFEEYQLDADHELALEMEVCFHLRRKLVDLEQRYAQRGRYMADLQVANINKVSKTDVVADVIWPLAIEINHLHDLLDAKAS